MIVHASPRLRAVASSILPRLGRFEHTDQPTDAFRFMRLAIVGSTGSTSPPLGGDYPVARVSGRQLPATGRIEAGAVGSNAIGSPVGGSTPMLSVTA